MELDTNSFTKPMNTHFWLPPSTHTMTLVIFLIITIFVPLSYCEENEYVYAQCGQTFQCGHLQGLSYPFFGSPNRSMECGQQGFELVCRENQSPNITINDQIFSVVAVNQSGYEMSIARTDLADGTCPQSSIFPDTTLNYSLFNQVTQGFQNLSIFYRCNIASTNQGLPQDIDTCAGFGNSYYATDQFLDQLSSQDRVECGETIKVPIPASVGPYAGGLSTGVEVLRLIRDGFNVSYQLGINENCRQCTETNGICATNSTTTSFTCLCNDRAYPFMCSPAAAGNGLKWRLKVIVGVVSGLGSIAMVITIFWCVRGNMRQYFPITFTGGDGSNQDIEIFLGSHGSVAVRRYSFRDVKKMTDNFRVKLGEGGYGSVYKGKLFDKGGSDVAVKVLKTSKGNNVEEFMNEVSSISRTSHVNIVILLGFCLEGPKRMLIYEFMPNGSLEKFLHHENDSSKFYPLLGWNKLYQIALGVARGLEYLHCGCNTRIVHFDIKPHNILLDEDHFPKISDFGLAKLCKKKESIVSMLEARGTIGYIAPEVFSRNFGEVSHKSDVYSYGMMVLDIVGGKSRENYGNNNTECDEHSSEEYFPHWIYRQLEHNKFELLSVDGLVTSTEEAEVVRKMTMVGLWCIQTSPLARPSISKVIEMLEGNIDALKIPPKPFLFSPPKSPLSISSCTNSMT